MPILTDPLENEPEREEIRKDLNIFIKHFYDLFLIEKDYSKKDSYYKEIGKSLYLKYGDSTLSNEFRKLTTFKKLNIDELSDIVNRAIKEP
jgi:hypothetical protein